MTVAALYIDPQGPYPELLGAELCWDEQRDARLYTGPWPVVAHPPCGPWGRLRHLYKGNEHDCALKALTHVSLFGGILEHPAGSLLWRRCGLSEPGGLPDTWGGYTIEVDQVEWGHVARKRTWLYIVGLPLAMALEAVRERPFPGRKPTHHVSRNAERARRRGYTLKRTSTKQNKLTPPAFAEWLVALAKRAKPGSSGH